MIPYRSIVVVGGGTAGWLSAVYLQRVLGANPETPISVRLVESPNLGIIGVGEATVPTLVQMLRTLGIPETRFLTAADATLKNGIRFVGWRQGGDVSVDRFDHPFDSPVLMEGYSTIVHWLNLKQRGLVDKPFGDASVVQTALFDVSASPKTMSSQPYEAPVAYAYHLDAVKFAGLLREVGVERGIEHIEADVVCAHRSDAGIESIELADGRRLAGDLFIDCTGFASLLIGKTLEVPWVSYAEQLLCDRAVACPVEYENPNGPLRSFTTATAKPAGWTWEIDLQSRSGTGYVYSSRHCSDDEALATLLAHHGDQRQMAEPRLLKMQIGHRARMWDRNCLAVGLSGGFIEPLESTGIYLIEQALQLFIDFLPASPDCDAGRNKYNELMSDFYDELRDFVQLHYVASMRRDTPFWRDCTQAERISGSLQTLLTLWDEKLPHATDLQRKMSLFGPANYFFILAGLNRLPLRGIGQAPYVSPDASQRALAFVAQIRKTATQQSPSMRDYIQKVVSAVRHAPTRTS